MRKDLSRRQFMAAGAASLGALAIGAGEPAPRRPARRVVVWSEGSAPRRIYPKDINTAIAEGLAGLPGWEVLTARLPAPDQGLPDELLDRTDVLIWWGHIKHDQVPDERADRIVHRVREQGMGFIALHASHFAKPNLKLMGTACSWKDYLPDSTTLRITVKDPTHPIARGITDFTIEQHERYLDPYIAPPPKAVVFEGTATLETDGVTTSQQGLTWDVGKGKVFYFQPGHETDRVFYDENIRRILANAVLWAAPSRP